MPHFSELARYSGTTIYNSMYMDDPKYRDLFGITKKLYDRWQHLDLEFHIRLSIEEDTITDIQLLKTRETSASARPTASTLVPTQQELRVVRRILEYITTP